MEDRDSSRANRFEDVLNQDEINEILYATENNLPVKQYNKYIKFNGTEKINLSELLGDNFKYIKSEHHNIDEDDDLNDGWREYSFPPTPPAEFQ